MPGGSDRSGVQDVAVDDWFSEREGWEEADEVADGRLSTGRAPEEWLVEELRGRPPGAYPEPEANALRIEARRAALVRRRRAGALSALLALLGVAIAVPLVSLGGEGEQAAEAPPTAAVTQATTTPVEQPAETTETTPAAEPAAQPLTVKLPEGGTLSLGDEGTAVAQLQKALAALELDPGEPDGIFGGTTQAAVVAFQEAHGLEPDGIVGKDTVRALNAALAERGITG